MTGAAGVRAGLAALALAAAAAVGAVVVAVGDARPSPAPPALVEVRVAHGRATGVVVAPGRVLTVAHVLSGSGRRARPTVTPPAGDRARVLAVDEAADLALLAVPGVHGPAVRLAPAPAATAAQPAPTWDTAPRAVRVLLPGGARPATARPARAAVTDVLGATVRRPVLRLGTAVAPGDSGSPVLDEEGRLAGVVFAADDDRPRTSWATAAPALRALLRTPGRRPGPEAPR